MANHRNRLRPRKKEENRDQLAYVSMGAGVFSLITAWLIPVLSILLALIGLVSGFASRYSSLSDLAKSGLIVSGLGLLVALIKVGFSLYLGFQ